MFRFGSCNPPKFRAHLVVWWCSSVQARLATLQGQVWEVSRSLTDLRARAENAERMEETINRELSRRAAKEREYIQASDRKLSRRVAEKRKCRCNASNATSLES